MTMPTGMPRTDRDLGLVEVVPVGEVEDLPLGAGEKLEQPDAVEMAGKLVGEGVVRLVGTLAPGVVVVAFSSAGACGDRVVDLVFGDAGQPGDEWPAVRAVDVLGLPGRQQDLLDDVVDLLLVS
ncbi:MULTISPECIES: hypothetical protein [Streptomyces]|uniref:hypothetical protein n=1 Tax=Streptomyces sp. SID5606 TaxID=2690305 RepID=UPI001E5C5285|nr:MULTISPECIES: hypothetical protein [Streptomyces]